MSFHSQIKLSLRSDRGPQQPPMIVLIPGGPCFSSRTLQDLEEPLVRANFDLGFVDPAGTGHTQPLDEVSYETLLCDLTEAILDLGRKVVLVGHSFGGVQAADLALSSKIPVQGLCCIATPLIKSGWDSLNTEYMKRHNDEMRLTEKQFEAAPSNSTFVAMNSTYGELYFSSSKIKEGVQWLAQDQIDHELFLKCTAGGTKDQAWSESLKKHSVPKLFIAGELDAMFPVPILEEGAHQCGFDFRVVPHAGHFVTYEQPLLVADLIEKFVSTL